jgi:tetratricopeptide (TPR) repeat protein
VAVELFEQLFATPHANTMTVHFHDRVWYAKALSAAGRHAEAKRVCEQTLADLGPDEFMYNRKAAIQQLALTEAALGDVQGAVVRLDAVIDQIAPHANPLWNGSAHRDRAKVALFAGDRASFEKHASAMGEFFKATRNASLIQQAEQFRKVTINTRGVHALDDAAIAFETAQSRMVSQDALDAMQTEATEQAG